MDQIAVVVVHYNSDQLTKNCLASLSELITRDFQYQVVIVDNGSKLPLTLTKSEATNAIEVLRSESNLGFTGGNNLGVSHAIDKYNVDYVLLLNNDTLVDPRLLVELHSYARLHPEAGVISPKIYFAPGHEYHRRGYRAPDRGRVIWYAGGVIDWTDLASFHLGIDELDRGQFDQSGSVEFVTGCAMLVRREILETVGLLDDRLFLYWEDVDFSLRVRQNGRQCHYCHLTHVWHLNAGTPEGESLNRQKYYQTRNRLWMGWRYGDWRSRWSGIRLGWRYLNSGVPQKKSDYGFN